MTEEEAKNSGIVMPDKLPGNIEGRVFDLDGYDITIGPSDMFNFPLLYKSDGEGARARNALIPETDPEVKAVITELPDGNFDITDDLGRPSRMVRIPKFKWSDVIEGGRDETCSAFIVGGREVDCIYVSKYMNIIRDGRAYSVYGEDPATMITIEDARQACAKKGRGWHMITNAEWCAIMHWCRKNTGRPHGNTYDGRDFYKQDVQEAVLSPKMPALEDVTAEMRTLTGTGPVTWSHDGTEAGIYDLVGNVWDSVQGFRIDDGEIQIIPDNDSALNVDEGPDSTEWRAILRDGTLVTPGTEGTLKYDGTAPGSDVQFSAMVKSGVRINDKIEFPHYTGEDRPAKYGFVVAPFSAIEMADGGEPPMILKELGIVPMDEDTGREALFLRNNGEQMAFRGGSWYDYSPSGMWELYLRDDRDYIFPDIGFRSAFVAL
ncbi:MAG: SUMF1/EgtB/PvdO family nonheme iron enzyme [Lachnospiraceae bacterium]|nr:SUMF1/EgtB/PvdO family nonheme iron enzyme [Lachnospiraceae bacterium]